MMRHITNSRAAFHCASACLCSATSHQPSDCSCRIFERHMQSSRAIRSHTKMFSEHALGLACSYFSYNATLTTRSFLTVTIPGFAPRGLRTFLRSVTITSTRGSLRA